MRLLFFCLISGLSLHACAQQDLQSSAVIEELMEQQTDESADLSEIAEMLAHLTEHPVNLNRADDDELRKAGIFSENFIRGLRNHISKYGKLIAPQELQQIEGADLDRIIPYITVGDINQPNATFRRMLTDGKHQLILRTQVIPESKKGYSENDYLGSPWSLYARYRFAFMNKLSWGITADKDAGEQFFNGANKKGFDFYSAHFVVRYIGKLNIIALGDYQVEYGQGLTVWTSMSGSKSSDPVLIRKNAAGIKPYTSSNEIFFKRGAAVSLKIKKINCDFFVSRKKMDANISSGDYDSLFTSFQQSGMHRTESELEDKNSITELFYGTHLRYSGKNLQAGITAASSHFSLPLSEGTDPYNQFEFSGKLFFTTGFDYSYNFRNINLFGEICRDKGGRFAYVNGVVISPDHRLAISVLHRNYPVKYQSLFSNAFRESGNNYNEQGIYAGLSLKVNRKTGVSCSFDRFFFPWLRYRTDAPSFGNELFSTFSYTPSRSTEIYIRYRQSNKFINGDGEENLTDYLVPVKREGIRIHLSTKISKSFTFRSRVEMSHVTIDSDSEKGSMLFQDIQFHPMGWPVAMNMRYAVFESTDYESRIYAYENDVLYGYSIPAFSDKGTRFYLNLRYKLMKGADIWFRYSLTTYSNLESIGSGTEEISGNKRSEFKFQVRFEW